MPFGPGERALAQCECMLMEESYVVRPDGGTSKKALEQLREDLLMLRDRMWDMDMVLDLVKFQEVPASVVTWIFAIGENLRGEGAQLLLMGIAPGAMPPLVMGRVLAEFEVI
jgi:hypothetical protein